MPETTPGTLVLISAPSGGGKNAVIRELLQRFPHSAQLVTTTTRPMRAGEQNGVDYHFLSRDAFLEKQAAGGFVETNEYAGNWYGTEWEKLNQALAQYDVVFSQAEVNGKENLDRQHVPHISIFLLPENLDILHQRLIARGGMDPANIAERLRIAEAEIEHGKRYDLALVNKEGAFQETIATVEKALRDALDKKASS